MVLDAVRLVKAVGKPVKVIWSREDDLATGKFRPMTAHHIEAGFDAGGKLDRVASPRGRPSRCWAIARASPARRRRRRIAVVMKGSPLPQYPIAEQARPSTSSQPGGARLSLGARRRRRAPTAFAIESFLDEIAKELGKDPIAFRLGVAEREPRVQDLLRTVARNVRLDSASATARGARRRRHGEGRDACGRRRRGLGRSRERPDQGAQHLGRHRCRHRGAADAISRRRPKAASCGASATSCARRSPSRTAACRRSNFTRLSGAAHVGHAQHRGQGDLDRQSADRRRRGRRCRWSAGAVGNAIAALTGVRLRELPFAPDRVRGALGA